MNTIQETLNEYSQNTLAAGDSDSAYYQQIQELQKSIYTYLDPAQWNTIKFENVFDRKDIKVIKEELISLAEKGVIPYAKTTPNYQIHYKPKRTVIMIGKES